MSNLGFITFTATLNVIPIVEISGRGEHVCVLFQTGSVVCFGRNNSGECGAGTNESAIGDNAGEIPALVPVLFKVSIVTVPVISISAGAGGTCSLFVNGRVICWGPGVDGLTGQDSSSDIGDGVNKVSSVTYIGFSDTLGAIEVAVNNHVCGLFVNSMVRCWGENKYANLGDNTTQDRGDNTASIASAKFVSFHPSINSVPIVSIAIGLYTKLHILYIHFQKKNFKIEILI